MVQQSGIMTLLFGKKKATKRRTTKKKAAGDKPVRPKGLTSAVRKMARKYKVKTRVMRGSKHVGYRKLSLIKRDIKKKKKKADKKAAAAKKAGGKPVRRRRRKASAFGVGGNYMPLSNFMSPYPYAVNSSPAWI
jgi:pyruvate/2-oxoglutarate dehydrogenase complex dihydrolipoamide acyltransferase (E2) component